MVQRVPPEGTKAVVADVVYRIAVLSQRVCVWMFVTELPFWVNMFVCVGRSTCANMCVCGCVYGCFAVCVCVFICVSVCLCVCVLECLSRVYVMPCVHHGPGAGGSFRNRSNPRSRATAVTPTAGVISVIRFTNEAHFGMLFGFALILFSSYHHDQERTRLGGGGLEVGEPSRPDLMVCKSWRHHRM